MTGYRSWRYFSAFSEIKSWLDIPILLFRNGFRHPLDAPRTHRSRCSPVHDYLLAQVLGRHPPPRQEQHGIGSQTGDRHDHPLYRHCHRLDRDLSNDRHRPELCDDPGKPPGVGVGFGLQNITNNFVSGFILLVERPIKVGDRIEVGPVTGDVVNISLRATTVVTNDNIAIIVPNSDFVSSRVTNWSYTDRDVRFNFPVGVSYRSDPEVVRQLLLQVADQHAGVLKKPQSDALLMEFGDSALNFVLRVWTRQYTTTPGVLRSELNFMISKTFKEHDIEIPFPQRDIHIRSGNVEGQPPQGSPPQENS
ncbi:MAG: mechanosensitive ion channel domain-containing protein [Nitrospirota bacterium]